MASSIASSAAFTSANMKPASGEQIDALWGQNIADNTGQLRARPLPIYGWGIDNVSNVGTTSVDPGDEPTRTGVVFDEVGYLPPGHSHLVGTFACNGTHSFTGGGPDHTGTFIWSVNGDLGTYTNTSSSSTGNTNLWTFGSTFAFSLDLASYVSQGSFFRFQYSPIGTSRDFGGGGNPWEGTITYRIGTFRMKTAWV